MKYYETFNGFIRKQKRLHQALLQKEFSLVKLSPSYCASISLVNTQHIYNNHDNPSTWRDFIGEVINARDFDQMVLLC